jgi:transcriptional antiterminator RfaH
MMEQWYVLHTKARCERQVAIGLHQRGVPVYLPLIWVSPVNPRASRERPFFPGYLFAKVDFQTVGIDILRWSPGVKGLVELSGQPVIVPDTFVTEMQHHLDRVRAIGGMAQDGVRRGEFVKLSGGPFLGYEGLFNARLYGADRAQILLACVQQEFLRQTLRVGRLAQVTNEATSQPQEGS